nr:uncharacterized protein LOC113804036 [Penaeus vannamei]
MDKKQIAVAMKLLKEAVKPILKSKALREAVAYLDDSLSSFNGDIETQLYLRLVLDSAQDIYEGKEAAQIHTILKEYITDMSDEETARNHRRRLGSTVTCLPPAGPPSAIECINQTSLNKELFS